MEGQSYEVVVARTCGNAEPLHTTRLKGAENGSEGPVV